ncbi:unnamed protein product [Closterium sp. NIES-53]
MAAVTAAATVTATSAVTSTSTAALAATASRWGTSSEQLNNYRPITLLNFTYKVLARVMADRMKSVLHLVISPEQYDFILGRRLSDAVAMVADIIDMAKNHNEDWYLLMVDFQKAFDSVSRDFLFEVLEKMGFPQRFVGWIKGLHQDTTTKLLINGWLGQGVDVVSRVRQGCPLVLYPFLCALEPLALEVEKRKLGLEKEGHRLGYLGYADDTTFVLQGRQQIAEAEEVLDKFEKAAGLATNKSKSVVLPLNANLKASGGSTSVFKWAGADDAERLLGVWVTPSGNVYPPPAEIWVEISRLLHGFTSGNRVETAKGFILWSKDLLFTPREDGGIRLYLLSDSRDSVSLFDHSSGAAPTPPATAVSATRSQWLTRDAAARLAIRNHLPLAECAHFEQHRTTQALYDAVVARYSSPATGALGRLLLPYLFPELSAFATVEDLVSHLRTSDARYRAAAPAEFLGRNQPPMFITLYFIVTRLPDSLRSVKDHFLSLTVLTIDLLEQHLLVAETSVVAVGAARGTPRAPFFEGCSPSPLAPSYASAAAVDVPGAEDVGAASASAKRRSSKGKGGRGGGGGGGGRSSGGGGSGGSGGGSGGFGGGSGGSAGSGDSGSGVSGGGRTGAERGGSGGGQRQRPQRRRETPSPQQLREWLSQRGASGGSGSCPSGVATFDLDYDAILSAMYALSVSAEGDCYLCAPPDPGIEAAALGASESSLPGTASAEALHTFTLDSGTSRYFLLVVVDYTRYTMVFPLRSKGEVPDVLIPWIHAVRLQLGERFGQDLCVLRLHSDREGEFSSDLLRDFCRGEGITQSFTLPASPQQNGIAERRIGLVMELNLWPCVSLPKTSPTLRWTGKVGDASEFWVWASRAFVRDTSADKLSARAIPCVFLGFPPDAPSWQFYHPTSRHVLPSQDVTFDESVPFCRLFPYRSAPPPPPLLFLARGPPPVDPLCERTSPL